MEPPLMANRMFWPEALMAPADHPVPVESVGRPCAAPRAVQVTPESEDKKRELVASDTMSWYWPVEDVASFLVFVRPDLAVCQDAGV